MPCFVHLGFFYSEDFPLRDEVRENLEISTLPFKLLGVLCVSKRTFPREGERDGHSYDWTYRTDLQHLRRQRCSEVCPDAKDVGPFDNGSQTCELISVQNNEEPIFKSERINTMANKNRRRKKAKLERENSFLCTKAKCYRFQTVTSDGHNNWFETTVYVDMLTLY